MGCGGAVRGGGLVLATAFLLAAASASADTDLGTVGGISYVSATTLSAPGGGGPYAALAACPGARPKPLGAGIYPSGEADEANVRQLYPSSPEDGVWGSFRNISGPNKTATVFAMCTARRVKTRTGGGGVQVNPGKSRVNRARCPKGTHVAGGGASFFFGGGSARLVSSHPFDGRDANNTPDDGWAARAYNYSTAPAYLEVVASCLASKRLRYRTSSGFEANCPDDGHLTGGGVKHRRSEASLAWMNTSAPLDTPLAGDTDDIPDDRWYARLPSYPRTVYAICLKEEKG